MSLKLKTKDYYYDKFQELFNSGLPIIDGVTDEVFEAAEGEIFNQCYADTPERNTFPYYWFVSNYANLISVGENKLMWVHKNQRENSGKFSYKYTIPTGKDTSMTKNIEGHNLAWLVHGAEAYGLAEQKIKDEGVFAFGIRTGEGLNVQGHHIDGNDTNNVPANGKFVTARVHTLFDSIPKPDATAEEQYKFMEKFGKIAKTENPNSITILFPGHTFKNGEWVIDKSNDITSTKEIYVTENFIRELQSMIKFMYEDMVKGEATNE